MGVPRPHHLITRLIHAFMIGAAVLLCPIAPLAAEGPSLPLAEYKSLPVGTTVFYNEPFFNFRVYEAEESFIKVRYGDGFLKFGRYYSVFGWAGIARFYHRWAAVDRELEEEDQKKLQKFWPLQPTSKTQFKSKDYRHGRHVIWSNSLRVVGREQISIPLGSFDTIKIERHSTLTGGDAMPQHAVIGRKYVELAWYHPQSGLILKFQRRWSGPRYEYPQLGTDTGDVESYYVKDASFPDGAPNKLVPLSTTVSSSSADRKAAEQAKREAEALKEELARILRLKREAEYARSAVAAREAKEEKAEAAEIAKLRREVEERRKKEARLSEREARELKAKEMEIARLRQAAEDRRKAEATRKAREAEAENARAREIARLKKEAEEAKAHAAEFARMKREAEEAEKAREAEIARLRKALEERASGTKTALSGLSGVEFGRYHALVIGIDDYKHLPKLKTAVADSVAVARVLKKDYGFKVTLLLDPDHNEIFDAFDEYRERLGPLDNLLIYYAGHGWLDEEVDRGYWLPINAKPNRRSQWVSNATITDTLKGLAAKHVMVIADSCYSGTLVRGAGLGPRTRTGDYWKQMARKWARVAITSGGLEPVADKGGGKNSPFAKALIDALKANDGVMDGTQLFSKMRRPVMVAAEQTPQYSDVRQAGHDGGDFLFVRKR